MDTDRFPKLISGLYDIVAQLEAMFGRPFTPDGHMVGSIGEALAAHYYGLTLTRPSTQGCDAHFGQKKVEIKATQGTRVSFRCKPDHLIVLKINKDSSFDEIYNGDGARVWALIGHRPMPSNGQISISLSALKKLARQVQQSEHIARVL